MDYDVFPNVYYLVMVTEQFSFELHAHLVTQKRINELLAS
jgi:hypothetical protein